MHRWFFDTTFKITKATKMKKGYWTGQVFEIKDEEKWINYLTKYTQIVKNHLENKTGNFLPVAAGQPKAKIQGLDLMFAAVAEFNSLQDALDCYKSEEYQSALSELGENPEESVVRNLSIFEG